MRRRLLFPVALFLSLATSFAGCGRTDRSVPVKNEPAAALSGLKAPVSLPLAVPSKPPNFIPAKPSSVRRIRTSHASFFAGEAALGNGVYYLALPNGNPFGYYSYLTDSNYLYHFDAGYEYIYDANDGRGGVYFYDFASGHWWYTGRDYPFPYIYDFSLSAFLYYYPDTSSAGHYTTKPRYFYNFTAGKIIALPDPVTEFTIPTVRSAPAGIRAGSDGALWFTEYDGNKIGRLTTSGAFTEYTVPSVSSGPYGITAGPDGALWFTEVHSISSDGTIISGGNKIGRVTTSGAFTEYTVPTANGSPEGITTGPDGALWFTESTGNKIGRVTTSGAFIEYTIPTASSLPSDITAGPDGALWFTETSGYGGGPPSKIGRVTTSGTITEYTLPNGSYGAAGITTGPDGALWFTERSNTIGRVTTSGAFTEFPIPFPAGSCACSNPMGIATGPDGALWFTLFNFGGTPRDNSEVGRMTTSGVFSFYTIGTVQSEPAFITPGPDGALWFTENNGGKIGRAMPQ